MKRYFGLFVFIIGLGILVSVLYLRSHRSQQTYTFSSYTLLTSSWEKYKIRFINQDGRVIDYSQNGITTSEGQSYAMLQAVWIDDKETGNRGVGVGVGTADGDAVALGVGSGTIVWLTERG